MERPHLQHSVATLVVASGLRWWHTHPLPRGEAASIACSGLSRARALVVVVPLPSHFTGAARLQLAPRLGKKTPPGSHRSITITLICRVANTSPRHENS